MHPDRPLLPDALSITWDLADRAFRHGVLTTAPPIFVEATGDGNKLAERSPECRL
jgi:hypothetical protein